jgi:hemerythrin-like domain-containing protein
VDQAPRRGAAKNGRMRDHLPVISWHEEHVYFNSLLELLRREVYVFHTGGRPNYELMYDIVSYLRDYGDEFHHPREDVAFDRLAQRLPGMEIPLARLAQEHRVIKQAGEKLLAQIDAVLGGAIVPRGELEMAAATYLVYYGNHLAKEEEDVLPLAAKYLTAEDWDAVRGALSDDPLMAVDAKRYRELRRRIALEA